jgi:hypothetical protein
MTTIVEPPAIVPDMNSALLKCPLLHTWPVPLPTSPSFLSESTMRLIRMGVKLIVMGVSEPRIALKRSR